MSDRPVVFSLMKLQEKHSLSETFISKYFYNLRFNIPGVKSTLNTFRGFSPGTQVSSHREVDRMS